MKSLTQNNSPISFIIPAYNCEKTIIEAIDSIFETNFSEADEVIIIDDCSSDNTKNLILLLQTKYPKIKLIKNSINLGCPATRNIGIREAINPLIFNLDSDDILEENSVKKLKDYLVKNNADLAAFGEIHFFSTNTKSVTHKWLCKTGELTLADYLSGPIVPGGNYIYTKASWEKINGYWEYGKGLHEFWGFTLKQLISWSKVVVMPDSYYFHRYSHNSLFRRENNEKESIIVSNKFIESALNLLSNETQKYIAKNPNWFSYLDIRPLLLKNHPPRKTGKVVFSFKIIQIKYLIKMAIKRIRYIIIKR